MVVLLTSLLIYINDNILLLYINIYIYIYMCMYAYENNFIYHKIEVKIVVVSSGYISSLS